MLAPTYRIAGINVATIGRVLRQGVDDAVVPETRGQVQGRFAASVARVERRAVCAYKLHDGRVPGARRPVQRRVAMLRVRVEVSLR